MLQSGQREPKMSSNNHDKTGQLFDEQTRSSSSLDYPLLSEIFPGSAQLPPATEPPLAETLPLEEQKTLLDFVTDVSESDKDATSFEEVPPVLSKLWHCQSQYLVRATEALANGSRNRQCFLSIRLCIETPLLTAFSFASPCVWPNRHPQLLPSAHIRE